MKIQANILRQFKSCGSFIRQNNLIPILLNLKFKDGKLTKNNLNAFLTVETGLEGNFLVDESLLMNFVENTSAPEIEITLHGKSIKISDGVTNIVAPTDSIENYPTNDVPEGKEDHLDDVVIYSMLTASRFVLPEEETPSIKSYVFVGNDTVCATNSFVAYTAQVGKVPIMVLPKEAINAIAKHDELFFSENKSYYFFRGGAYTYGFSKPVLLYTDMTPAFRYNERQLPKITIPKSELVAFNGLCVAAAHTKTLTATIEKNGCVKLRFRDPDFDIDIKKDLPSSDEVWGKFSYNPAMMNIALKSMDDESLDLILAENRVYVKGDDKSAALVMQSQTI